MSLKPCRKCKQEVYDKAKTCPHCGAKVPALSTAKGYLWIIITAFVLTAFILFFDDGEPKSSEASSLEVSSSVTAGKEIPLSERPLIEKSERDQLIADMSNSYLENMTDLISNYDTYLKGDRFEFINWCKSQWLPHYEAQEEHFSSIIGSYRNGSLDKDLSKVQSAFSNLGLVSTLLMKSIKDHDFEAVKATQKHLHNDKKKIIDVIESRKLEQYIIAPDEMMEFASE